jgi:hypothetical protein
MSGIDDLMAESNDRWASARRRAQGIADHGMGVALKNYFVFYLPVGFVVLISIGTIGGMLAMAGAIADWSSYLLFGFFLALLGALIGGLVYNAKKVRPAAELGRVDVLFSLQQHEQKHVRRQILGKVPLDVEHLAVTRGAAVQLRKNLATQLILAPPFLIAFLPQAVPVLDRNPIWWLVALFVCAYAVSMVFLGRDFRRAGRFLTQTAPQASAVHGE